jgi:hypothetical protein
MLEKQTEADVLLSAIKQKKLSSAVSQTYPQNSESLAKRIKPTSQITKRRQTVSEEQAKMILSGGNPFITTKYKILKLKDTAKISVLNLKNAIATNFKVEFKDVAGVYLNQQKNTWYIFINSAKLERNTSNNVHELLERIPNLSLCTRTELLADSAFLTPLVKDIKSNEKITNKAFQIAMNILGRGLEKLNEDDIGSLTDWEEVYKDLTLLDIVVDEPRPEIIQIEDYA